MTATEIYGQRRIPWVAILHYHRVVPRLPDRDPFGNCTTTTAFEAHLRWLRRRRYQALTIAELAQSAVHGRVQRGLRVAITFDDGYEDNFIHAFPLLERYGFNATIFVVTDTIGGYNDFDAGIGGERVRMLSADQIKSLARGGIEIGSHTRSHPQSLPDLSDHDLQEEVRQSRAILGDIGAGPMRSFAYPHSRVSQRAEAAVEEAGYQAACAGVGTTFTPYRLCRVATSAGGGPVLEAAIGWRWLKQAVANRAPMEGFVPA